MIVQDLFTVTVQEHIIIILAFIITGDVDDYGFHPLMYVIRPPVPFFKVLGMSDRSQPYVLIC